MDEFDCLKECLPLADNLNKYLCIKTKINYFSDFEFSTDSNLKTSMQKFAHTGWREMRPLIVGIKCYLNDQAEEARGYVDILHSDKQKEKTSILESLTVRSEVWYQFKAPLLEAYHTRSWISLSLNISAFTVAILNTSAYVRDKHATNYFPAGYVSYDLPYDVHNLILVYEDEKGGEANPYPEAASASLFRVPYSEII
jgi:hypothetical protein